MRKEQEIAPKKTLLSKFSNLFKKRKTEPKLKESSLIKFAGREWGKILEINIEVNENKGKTIIFPKKENYTSGDICLATGTGFKNIRHRIEKTFAPNEENLDRFNASEKFSFTEAEFVELVTTLASKVPELPPARKEAVLPDGKTLLLAPRGMRILEQFLTAPSREILKSDLRTVTVNFAGDFDSAIETLNNRLSKAGWEIKKAPAPGKDKKLTLKPIEETVLTDSGIGNCPQELPEETDKQPSTVERNNRFKLLSSNSLSEAEKREVAQIKNLIKSALTGSLLRHLAEKTQPQKEAIEFIKPLIPFSAKESRKIMQQIICWSDQHIVKAVIIEYFTAGIKDLIIRGKNPNPPLTPEKIEAYQHYGQLIEEGYTLERIIEAISNFFPEEEPELTK